MSDQKKSKEQLIQELLRLRQQVLRNERSDQSDGTSQDRQSNLPWGSSLAQSVYAHAPVGLCCLDSDLRYVHINEWLAALNGFSVREHLGRRLVDLLPDVAAAGAEAQLRGVLETGQPVVKGRVEAETAAHPGTKRFYEHSYRALEVDGEIRGVYCVVEDVTDAAVSEDARLDAELRRTASEREYQQLVDAAGIRITRVALDQTILFMNGAAAATFGGVPSDFVGKPLVEVLPDSPSDVSRRIESVVASGVPESRESAVQRLIGSRWIQATMHPVLNGLGVVDSVLVISEDITKVIEAEQRLTSILELAPTAFIMVDDMTRITMVNRAMETLFGYARDELLGQLLEILIPPKLRSGHAERVKGFFSAPKARTMQGDLGLMGMRKDGTTIPVEIGLCPYPTSDGIGVLASLVDTTERQRAMDAMSRAMELKDGFLAGMSHELRTPLGAILGVTEALQERIYGDVSAEQREPLRTIEASARHLLSLVDEVLDLSRLEAGAMEVRLEMVSVDALCSEAIRLIRPQARAAKLRLSTSDDGRTSKLQGDPRRLKQILLNLLSNAVKFTPEGGEVSLEVTRRSDDLVAIMVRDTGIGVAPDKLSLLFKPFVQIDGGLNRSHKGSGLGLALSEQLAGLHGGHIEVESEVGKGSSFSLVLPLRSGPLAGKLSGVESEPRTAVLVEDSKPAARLMKHYLVGLGMEVTLLPDGQDVVDIVERLQPSIVVLDLLLPDGSGLHVLKSLKQRESTREVPVLVASIVDEAAHSLSAGAELHLTKPFTRNTFEAAVGQCARDERNRALVATVETARVPLALIVDDTPTNITHVRDYLLSRHWRVETASSGDEALDKARKLRPEAVLMDIQMPGMDGLEAIQRLRGDERTRETFVVAVTGLALPGDRERCMEAGANDYLSKPYSLRSLTSLLAAAVKTT